MQELAVRALHLIVNTIAVLFLMALVEKDFVVPIIGVWILTELCMVQKKMQEWEQQPEEPPSGVAGNPDD